MNPSDRFIQHHRRLIGRFEALLEESLKRPLTHLGVFVEFLRNRIEPHLRAEESKLYDVVDEKAGTKLATASLRQDHRELENRIGSFDVNELNGPEAIRRKLHQFSALLLNHFQTEEEIILPYLEDRLARDAFEDLLSTVHENETVLRVQ